MNICQRTETSYMHAQVQISKHDLLQVVDTQRGGTDIKRGGM